MTFWKIITGNNSPVKIDSNTAIGGSVTQVSGAKGDVNITHFDNTHQLAASWNYREETEVLRLLFKYLEHSQFPPEQHEVIGVKGFVEKGESWLATVRCGWIFYTIEHIKDENKVTVYKHEVLNKGTVKI